jgi:hypothetical protein
VKKNTGSQDLDTTHGAGAPSHDELTHGARVWNLFPASCRSIVGHRNLVVVEPKQRGTLDAAPHHGDSVHVNEVCRTHGEYGALNLLTLRRRNHGDSGGGRTLAVVGGEWDVGSWACAGVFIYDGSVQTGWHRCDMGGPDQRTEWGWV